MNARSQIPWLEFRFDHGVLDRDVAALLERERAKGGAPPWESSLDEVRAGCRTSLIREWAGPAPQGLGAVADLAAGGVPLRLYLPPGAPPFPLTIFIHGGGWVVCDLDTHDNLCRSLCLHAETAVVSVGYRRAPEHPFPAALDDVRAAADWAAAEGPRLGIDPGRLAVAGDSAGGNLAAAFCISLRDRGEPRPRHQLLMYPVTDISSFDRDSYRRYGEGYIVSEGEMRWYADAYAPEGERRRDPLVSPLLCPDLSGLAPAQIITADFDLLRDEGEAYARRLHDAGTPVACTRFGGMVHGFLSMDGRVAKAREALAMVARRLKSALA